MGLMVYRDGTEKVICDQCGQEIRDASLIAMDGWVIHYDCVREALTNKKFRYDLAKIVQEHAEEDTEGWKEEQQ